MSFICRLVWGDACSPCTAHSLVIICALGDILEVLGKFIVHREHSGEDEDEVGTLDVVRRSKLRCADSAYDALSLEIGVPTYLESNTGYHIVKVISHNDARMLTLDDRIDPTQNYTVRDYITEGLAYQNYQAALTEALNDLIAELRSEASIRILYK